MKYHELLVPLLIGLPQAVQGAAPDTASGGIPSIVELVGAIVDTAKALDGILLFLILIAVLGVIAVTLHLWHGRDSITLSLFVLLALAVGVAAYQTRDVRNELQVASQSRLFLPLGESRALKPFSITLDDVDTLKAKIKNGEIAPWEFNLKFGEQALLDFFRLGKTRLEADFVMEAGTISQWPNFDEIASIGKTNDSDAWNKLVDRLKFDIFNPKTERTVKLKEAFSKWPLIKLQIRDLSTSELLVDRYFPDRGVILLKDSQGDPYRIEIETIFNGDRDLGEAEACVIRLLKDEEEAT